MADTLPVSLNGCRCSIESAALLVLLWLRLTDVQWSGARDRPSRVWLLATPAGNRRQDDGQCGATFQPCHPPVELPVETWRGVTDQHEGGSGWPARDRHWSMAVMHAS